MGKLAETEEWMDHHSGMKTPVKDKFEKKKKKTEIPSKVHKSKLKKEKKKKKRNQFVNFGKRLNGNVLTSDDVQDENVLQIADIHLIKLVYNLLESYKIQEGQPKKLVAGFREVIKTIQQGWKIVDEIFCDCYKD